MQKEIRNSQNAGEQPADGVVKNAKDYPSFYYCRHMQPGLAGYENERILVDADAIKKMLPSLAGKPIYLNHRDVELDTIKTDAAGYVAESFWNELDGWAWTKMLLIDEAAHLAATGGWSVSNAYVPTDWAGGGTCNNVEYDRSITNGKFTHLAMVQDPRYEAAKIFSPEEFKRYQEGKRQQLNELKNSKTEPKKGKAMFTKLFANKREEVSTIEAATHAEFQNAKGETVTVSVEDMVKAVENSTKQAESAAQTVLVNGKQIPMEELTKAYLTVENAKSMKKNEAEDKKDEAADLAKENAEDEKDEKENADDKDETKENSKTDHFKEISNANRSTAVVTTVDTQQNKVQRGKSRYGSGN